MRTWLIRLGHICILAAAIAVWSEQRSCAAPSLALPPAAAEWKLASPQNCAKPVPENLQIWRGTLGARRVCHAEYGGSPDSPKMMLTIYEMPEVPGATAFDAFQKWRKQPGKMAFYKGGYFGVVESPGADMNVLNRFTIGVEAALPAGNEGRW